MGKQNNILSSLLQQKQYIAQNNDRVMRMYGHLMDDRYKQLQTSKNNSYLASIEQQIAIQQEKAMAEVVREATAQIVKNTEIELKTDAVKLAKELKQQLDDIFSK